VKDRVAAVEKYREWFTKERLNNPQVYQILQEMKCHVASDKDINLVCYCHPHLCHGSVIKEYLEENLRIRSESLGEMEK
jgi:uncharacterized protein YeaO (DUF488 family)